MEFFFFGLLVWWTILIFVQILNHFCTLGIKIIWTFHIIIFINWLNYLLIIYRLSTSQFMEDIDVKSLFLHPPLLHSSPIFSSPSFIPSLFSSFPLPIFLPLFLPHSPLFLLLFLSLFLVFPFFLAHFILYLSDLGNRACVVSLDMSPPPQWTGGCLASSHRERGKQSLPGVPAFSRSLCLSQPCSIFTRYCSSLPTATASSLTL